MSKELVLGRVLAGLSCLGAFGFSLLSQEAAGAQDAPRRWTNSTNDSRVKEIAARLPAKPAGFGRPISDRTAWDRLAGTASFSGVVSNAEALAREPVPALPDDLYLDYSKTGNRDRCQKVMFARGARIVAFTLAECLENRGRFLGPLTDTLTAVCQERTWVYPAHDGRLDNFHGRTVEMDLRATAVGWELATADYLLREKLSPKTRQMLRENVERRVLDPFRDMVEGRRPETHWLRATHNWNAVCLAGVTGAALALEESPLERAQFVAAAEHYIKFFLSGFTPDGYCSEGMGYWNYGFGHFLMLGEALRQATGGAVDLLAEPSALAPALFCTRAEILDGIYPTIADCSPGSRPAPGFVGFIRERLGEKDAAGGAAEFVRPQGSLAATMMFSFLDRPLPELPHRAVPPGSPLRTWFKDGGVLICRPDPGAEMPFAVALKGGHNAEHHNHNDVGSFSVVAGKTMVICDPGSEVYTARTFSARRYDSKVLNSYGHAVPLVAGQLQQPGAKAKGVVLRADFGDSRDILALDIRSAYPVPELQRLERTFEFRRGAQAALTVHDDVAFSEPKAFESALITWGTWKKLSESEVQITDETGAVKVRIDTGGEPFQLRWEELDEDVPSGRKPKRLGIALVAPVKAAALTLTIQPVR